jgi:Dolichyl-phosphate-mannose-protein mannosyltransferase
VSEDSGYFEKSESHFSQHGHSNVSFLLFLHSQFSFRHANLIRKRAKKDQPAQQAVVAKDYRNNLPFDDWVIVLGLTVLAAVVRLWKIDYPTSVVFDEVHFGGFATK